MKRKRAGGRYSRLRHGVPSGYVYGNMMCGRRNGFRFEGHRKTREALMLIRFLSCLFRATEERRSAARRAILAARLQRN